MKPIKAVFFDVDGTLVSFTTHEVVPSSIRALKKLREAGIKCILATGRPIYMVPFLDLSWFDAFVTFNGQYCFVGDDLVVDRPLDPKDVACAVQHVKEKRYACLFMEGKRAYSSYKDENCHKLEELINAGFPEGDIEQALVNPIYQLNAYLTPGNEHLLADDMEHIEWTRWCDYFIDVIPEGGGKEAGVAKILDYLGIDPEEAAAFGDGGNDVGMLQAVGCGIAMGNATEELKEVADLICEDCDHDGIYNECVRLGLIQ